MLRSGEVTREGENNWKVLKKTLTSIDFFAEESLWYQYEECVEMKMRLKEAKLVGKMLQALEKETVEAWIKAETVGGGKVRRCVWITILGERTTNLTSKY